MHKMRKIILKGVSSFFISKVELLKKNAKITTLIVYNNILYNHNNSII